RERPGRSGTPRRRQRRGANRGRPRSRRRPCRFQARGACGRSAMRSRRGSPRALSRREPRPVFSLLMGLADQLTLARALAVPVVVVLYVWEQDWLATGVFIVA